MFSMCLRGFSPGASSPSPKTCSQWFQVNYSKLPIGGNGCRSLCASPVTDWQPVHDVPHLSPFAIIYLKLFHILQTMFLQTRMNLISFKFTFQHFVDSVTTFLETSTYVDQKHQLHKQQTSTIYSATSGDKGWTNLSMLMVK